MLPTSIDFFIAFFGILYAGAIPVPIYPPMRLSQLEDHLRRQTGILRNAGACMLITMPEGRRLAGLLRAQVETLSAVESVDKPRGVGGVGRSASAQATRIPSRSSNTHPAAPATRRASCSVTPICSPISGRWAGSMEASSADVFVSWLPLYHDMGLIGAWLGCLHYAAPLYAMSPLSFLVRPESWLWAIHRFRATFSASPNFGFELCLNKIADADLEGLDLSSLRMVANGAEPVSVQTLRRFIERFGRYGFPAQAMAPVYGLAESSVGLAFPPLGRPPVIDRVDRERLSTHGVAEPAKPDDPRPLEIVACGQPLPGHEIRIVDEAGYELGERREGRLEFRGPSTTRGYFRNETKTRELFHDGWLDSGDRAYMAGGDVYITGRIKDIIIRAGRHLYPQEIEEAVAEIPGIRKGGVAVFGVTDRASGTERVVVLAETRETDPAARAALQARAHEVTTDIAGTPPDEIVLAPPRTVPKTSSGKIRRSAAKELYESGRIGAGTARLYGGRCYAWCCPGSGPRLRRLVRLSGETFTRLGGGSSWRCVSVWHRSPCSSCRASLGAGLRSGGSAAQRLRRWGSRSRSTASTVFRAEARCWYSIIPVTWISRPRRGSPGRTGDCRQERISGAVLRRPAPAAPRHTVRRALRRLRQPRRCRSVDRARAPGPYPRVLSGRHIHPKSRPFRVLSRCVQGRGRGGPANPARRHPRDAIDAAQRSMVSPARCDQRRDRRAGDAVGYGFHLSSAAARCGAKCYVGALRGARPWAS